MASGPPWPWPWPWPATSRSQPRPATGVAPAPHTIPGGHPPHPRLVQIFHSYSTLFWGVFTKGM
jgi:hypothetical protein